MINLSEEKKANIFTWVEEKEEEDEKAEEGQRFDGARGWNKIDLAT